MCGVTRENKIRNKYIKNSVKVRKNKKEYVEMVQWFRSSWCSYENEMKCEREEE